MPTDANGNYSLPAGYLAVSGNTILTTQHNPPLEDIASALTGRLMRSGVGGMTGPLKATDGSVGAPSMTFGTALTTGSYKTANGIGFAVSGTLVAEIGAGGFLSGVGGAAITDKSIPLRKLVPSGSVSTLIGTPSIAPTAVTGAANNGAGLIRLAVVSTTGLTTGVSKAVTDVVGTTEANGTWTITVIDATHVDLQGSTFANGYVSGGTLGGTAEKITLGAGLTMTNNVLSAGAAPAPMSGAVGLAIINNAGTPNSIIDVAAAEVTMLAAGVPIWASLVSVSVNTSTTGANGLDTGARAANTWYNLFLISNGTIVAGLASLSASAPTMPVGYTYLFRAGAMRTDGSGNFFRSKQLGQSASYMAIAGTNTPLPPPMATGSGGLWQAAATANFIPPSSSKIRVQIGSTGLQANGQYMAVAPNNQYTSIYSAPIAFSNDLGGSISTALQGMALSCEIVLESFNVYWAASTNMTLRCLGWTDRVNAS